MHNPDQKWHYLSGMDFDDIILLKVYDSDPGVEAKRASLVHLTAPSGCAADFLPGCLHSAFPLDDGASQIPRESIELRILVFTES